MAAVFERQQLEKACWLILFSAVLDLFDGLIARLTHTESKFGLHYDSLSDLVAFGVAPSILMLSFLGHDDPQKITTLACSLYIVCGALRLARFNVQALGQESKTFTGLPIPAAAGALVTFYLAFREWDALLKLCPLYIIALSILMVSEIPYPSLKAQSLKNRKPFDFLVIVAVCAIFLIWVDPKGFAIWCGFFGYVAWSACAHGVRHAKAGWAALRARRHKPTDAESAESAPGE
ncbi:MAG: CDP-alcohol phosphatidyltransferase [candidate division BRC1 bacterium ADurb.BinA364]|nr:MAG: CDP-alcohol phosphatidyltransferase [candidate division BRC1 bacterium ADurb.BinA364]